MTKPNFVTSLQLRAVSKKTQRRVDAFVEVSPNR